MKPSHFIPFSHIYHILLQGIAPSDLSKTVEAFRMMLKANEHMESAASDCVLTYEGNHFNHWRYAWRKKGASNFPQRYHGMWWDNPQK